VHVNSDVDCRISQVKKNKQTRDRKKDGVGKEGGDFPASYERGKGTNIAVRSPIAEKKKRK
jgi:hypothetical protein